MKKNKFLKIFFALIIGLFLFIGGVYADQVLIGSDEVSFDNSNGMESTNVQSVIEELNNLITEHTSGGGSGVLNVSLTFTATLGKNGSNNGVYYNRTSSTLNTTISVTINEGVITNITSSSNSGTTGTDSWDAQYARVTSSLKINSYEWIPS